MFVNIEWEDGPSEEIRKQPVNLIRLVKELVNGNISFKFHFSNNGEVKGRWVTYTIGNITSDINY